jgi:hypothetical protein
LRDGLFGAFRLTGRLVAYALLLALGAAVGVAGAFIQAVVVRTSPVPVPAGLVLALGGTAAAFTFGALVMRSRAGVIVPAIAWLLAVLMIAAKRPEGDVVLANSGTAYGYLFGGTLLGAVLATVSGAWSRRSRGPTPEPVSESPAVPPGEPAAARSGEPAAGPAAEPPGDR